MKARRSDARASARGSADSELMLGAPRRRVRYFAKRNGVPVWHLGTKSTIPAEQLFQAMKRAAIEKPVPELTDEEMRAEARAQLEILLREPRKTWK